MYETLEFYDSNGCDLKEVLKSCIYKYYMENRNSLKVFKTDKKNKRNSLYQSNVKNQMKVLSKNIVILEK